MLKTLFGKDHKEFSTGQQQDAREYLVHFIEKLQKMEKASKTSHDPTKAFEFDLETRLQCTTCHRVKYNTETCYQLMV